MSHAMSWRMNRRKLLGAGLLGAGAILAACGTDEAPGDEDAPEQNTPAAPPADDDSTPTTTEVSASESDTPAEGTEVIWSCYSLGARNQALEEMAESVSEETGLKVTLRLEPSERYWDTLQLRYTGGGAPDIAVNQVNWIQGGAARGMFVPLDDYMSNDGINRDDYLDWVSWQYQDELYGLPFTATGENAFLNKELFSEAGLELPTEDWSWDIVHDLATELTKGSGPGRQYGLQVGDGIATSLGTFILNNGGKVLNDARDEALYGEDPQAIEAAQWVVDTMLKDNLAPTPASLEGQPQPFATGRVAINLSAFYNLANFQEGIGAENVAFLRIPKGPAGLHTVGVGSNAWSILSSTDVPEAAWTVIRTISDETRQSIWATLQTPALLSVFNSPDYLENTYPGQEEIAQSIFDHWSKEGRDYFITPDAAEWWEAADNALDPMYVGEKPVAEAMKESADAVNAIFAQRPSE